MKILLTAILLLSLGACSSTVNKVSEVSSEASSDASKIENAAYNIERAISSGERIKKKIEGN